MEIDIKRNRQIKLKGHRPKCAIKNEMKNDNIKEIEKEIHIGTEEVDKIKNKYNAKTSNREINKDRDIKNRNLKRTLTLATVGIAVLASKNASADTLNINTSDNTKIQDEAHRQRIGVDKNQGYFNLGGTTLKGVVYRGEITAEDSKLWELSIQELMSDISTKTNLDMSLFKDVTFTISPYKLQGISGLTHNKDGKFNIILSRDMSGIPMAQYKKEIMKEVIAHELGHVVYKQADVRDAYANMINNNLSNSSTSSAGNVNTNHSNWENSIEENFAEDIKVYIIENTSTRAVQNNTNYSASKNKLYNLLQKSEAIQSNNTNVSQQVASTQRVRSNPQALRTPTSMKRNTQGNTAFSSPNKMARVPTMTARA